MLTGILLKDRKSICLSGDRSDLASLQQTIAKVTQLFHENKLANTEASQLFSNFQESITTSLYQKPSSFVSAAWKNGHSSLPSSYSLTGSWTELLIIFNLFVSLSDYIITDASDKVNLLLLENILQNAASVDSPAGSLQRKHFIGKRFVFNNLKSFIKEFTYDRKLVNEVLKENKSMKPS